MASTARGGIIKRATQVRGHQMTGGGGDAEAAVRQSGEQKRSQVNRVVGEDEGGL